jgi:hypothetical protein
MTDLIGVMSGLWADVGPGLLLAAALPLFLIALGAVALEGWRRVGRLR